MKHLDDAKSELERYYYYFSLSYT